MFTQRKLSKMGYKKGELNSMEIKDIIELGKLGYTKEEINQLKAEETPKIPDDVETRLNALNEKLDALTASAQSAAAHQTATTNEPKVQTGADIGNILSQLAGVNPEQE